MSSNVTHTAAPLLISCSVSDQANALQRAERSHSCSQSDSAFIQRGADDAAVTLRSLLLPTQTFCLSFLFSIPATIKASTEEIGTERSPPNDKVSAATLLEESRLLLSDCFCYLAAPLASVVLVMSFPLPGPAKEVPGCPQNSVGQSLPPAPMLKKAFHVSPSSSSHDCLPVYLFLHSFALLR